MPESRLPIHPYAELFPPMSAAEFDGLCSDISANGLHEEIVVHEGRVLDGRHRYQACLVRQVPPRFRAYAGECGSPLAFLVSKNVRRRNMTESQRALVAAGLTPLFEDEARQRQRAGLKQGSELPVVKNSSQRENPKETGRSVQKAAQLLNVSHVTVQAAAKVKKQGVSQLINAVAAGKLSVTAAARLAQLPAEQQIAAVAGIENGLKPKQALAQATNASPAAQITCVDDAGQPVPEGIVLAFEQREDLGRVCRRLEALAREIKRLGECPVGCHLDVESVLEALEKIGQTLSAGRPARLCPHLPGEASACARCRGHGWLPAGMGKHVTEPPDKPMAAA